MAFLDNSGDIILDAVLTDTGRRNLARGDGTFSVVKFALGDDEINYGTVDLSAVTPDLTLARTPVLEAFTNNGSMLHSKLQTYDIDNILYLPVLKINDETSSTSLCSSTNGFVIPTNVSAKLNIVSELGAQGIVDGTGETTSQFIRIDQGIDNAALYSSIMTLDSRYNETQYLIEMDDRLGYIAESTNATNVPKASFIDDDNIAAYYLSSTTSADFISSNTSTSEDEQIIAGPRGTTLKFRVNASSNISNSTSLFTTLGGTWTPGSVEYYYIDSFIRVTGLVTGYRIDVPVRYIYTTAAEPAGL